MEEEDNEEDAKSSSSESSNSPDKKSDEEEDGKDCYDVDNVTITEKIIPEFDDYDKAEFIAPKNVLMKEVPDQFLKMTPYDLFVYYYDEFIQKICDYSNQYAIDTCNWIGANMTKQDIYLYLFVYIYLSVYDLPEIEMLWENSPNFKCIMPSIISKGRHGTINKYFQISSYFGEDRANKADKINGVIEYLNKKWVETYPYTKYLSIDEAMTSYKGSVCFKQYMKEKHKRFGIKLFSKASADRGYCYHMLLYTGKAFQYDKRYGIGTTVVMKLSKGHENQGYHFTFDSYFSNLHTFYYCEKNKIDFTCTFSLQRKALPKEIKGLCLQAGEAKYYTIDKSNVKLFVCRDGKKQIQMASNVYDIQFKKYKNRKNKIQYKNEIIANYNLTKSGVDLIDSATQIYKTQRKTNKWWKAVFFYLLDVTLNNMCIIYNSSDKFHTTNLRNGALSFRRILIEQFISLYNKQQITNTCTIIREVHVLVPNEQGVKTCVRCKAQGSMKGNHYFRTRHICNICKKPLCRDCFIQLHIDLK